MGEAAIQMSTLISSTSRTVVVGLGTTGLAVARHLDRLGRDFCVVDTREAPPCVAEMRAEMPAVPLLLGAIPQDVLNTAGELIVSPGIAPAESWLQEAVAAGATLRGDIDLFMEAAQAPVVGITGSNAKSTVTELVGAMARRAGRCVGVGGNLGTAALDLLDDDRDLYVLELSSFQLERSGNLGLSVATVLNVTPDHLDRHGDMPRYHQAKHRIFHGCDTVVFNRDDPLTIPPQAEGRRSISWRLGEPDLQGYGLRVDGDERYIARGLELLMPVRAIALAGEHNLGNALAALALGEAAGLPRQAMLETLEDFAGLPHRCETVLERNGVRWINDSKATNTGAALAAIEGLGASSRVVLIAGGRDKNSDFSLLRDAVRRHCDEVLLIGEAAATIAEALEGCCDLSDVGTLEEAVALAAARVQPGQVVLLSPACASFDQFRGFEHRGDTFREAVQREVSA